MECADFFERVARSYGVNNKETLPCAHILFPHRPAKRYTLKNNLTGWHFRRTYPYSSCPAVSRTSRSATSSSITHCFRYESEKYIRDRPEIYCQTHLRLLGHTHKRSGFGWTGWSRQTFRHLGHAHQPTFWHKSARSYRHLLQLRACTLSRIVPVLRRPVSAANLIVNLTTLSVPWTSFLSVYTRATSAWSISRGKRWNRLWGVTAKWAPQRYSSESYRCYLHTARGQAEPNRTSTE